MRRTRRWLTGTVLAVTLGVTGCSDSAAGDPPGDAVPSEEADSSGDPDPVDGGEEDPDGIDPERAVSTTMTTPTAAPRLPPGTTTPTTTTADPAPGQAPGVPSRELGLCFAV